MAQVKKISKGFVVKCTQCGTVIVNTRKKAVILKGRVNCSACGIGTIGGRQKEHVDIIKLKPKKKVKK